MKNRKKGYGVFGKGPKRTSRNERQSTKPVGNLGNIMDKRGGVGGAGKKLNPEMEGDSLAKL